MDITTINTIIGGALGVIGVIGARAMSGAMSMLTQAISRLIGRIDKLEHLITSHHDTLSDLEHRVSALERKN